MDTSAISGTSPTNTYVATTGGSSDSGTDFASVLASQSSSGDGSSTTSTSAADQALNSYSAGQVTAYALQSESSEAAASTSESTSESEASGETSETSSAGAGFPAEVGSEWTPSHMQFYDEVYGRWVDDNIPHRINENGDLEYQYEGEWYLDVAVRHRVLDEEGNVIAYMDESGNPIQEGAGENVASEGEAEGEGGQQLSFQVDEYFNEALQAWKIFNFPDRIAENGQRQYFWADAWHDDNWQHRPGGSSETTEVASNSGATSEESSGSSTEGETSTETTSGEQTAQAA